MTRRALPRANLSLLLLNNCVNPLAFTPCVIAEAARAHAESEAIMKNATCSGPTQSLFSKKAVGVVMEAIRMAALALEVDMEEIKMEAVKVRDHLATPAGATRAPPADTWRHQG